MSKTLVITRVLDAPVEKVWAAWTEPEQIKKWWGPKDFTAPSITVDLREGGKYHFCMHGKPAPDMAEQDFWSGGTYEEIVPLKKLVYLDSFADAEGNLVPAANYGMPDFPDTMRVTLEFETQPDGKTKMTLHHEGVPDGGDNAANMETGWNQSLDKLAESVR